LRRRRSETKAGEGTRPATEYDRIKRRTPYPGFFHEFMNQHWQAFLMPARQHFFARNHTRPVSNRHRTGIA